VLSFLIVNFLFKYYSCIVSSVNGKYYICLRLLYFKSFSYKNIFLVWWKLDLVSRLIDYLLKFFSICIRLFIIRWYYLVKFYSNWSNLKSRWSRFQCYALYRSFSHSRRAKSQTNIFHCFVHVGRSLKRNLVNYIIIKFKIFDVLDRIFSTDISLSIFFPVVTLSLIFLFCFRNNYGDSHSFFFHIEVWIAKKVDWILEYWRMFWVHITINKINFNLIQHS